MSKKIDWSDYNQLAKDVWLYLTNDKMPESATISRDALVHEVQAMIQSACMFSREEVRRVKKQRNAYEQELLLANRRLLKMKVELEIEKEKQLLPNLQKSTKNLSKITDKDEWLKEVRGEEMCVAGCKTFTGGEKKHHPDCQFYPESLSKRYDEMQELLLQAKYQLAAIDNQWPTKGTKAVIQEIENFLK